MESFTLTVGKTYHVQIHSEMDVEFTSKLVKIQAWDQATDTYTAIESAVYESDFHVDELTFENGVVVASGGMMEFTEV